MLALLLLAGAVNYVDRITLSVANPLIAAELHLRPAQMGVLLSAFLWSYALAQAPAGLLIDRLGPKRLLAAAMGLWSTAQAATGFAPGLPALILARLALGVGESPQWPVGARVVRIWLDHGRRGAATGVFNSASTLGPAIAPPIVTALMLGLGWRGAFVATGVAGVAVAALWLAVYRDPPNEPQPQGPLATVSLRRLFAHPTLWAMALGNTGSGYMNWFYATWLPGYLEAARHLSIAKTGWAASIPYLFGFLGSLAGGWACDRLARAGVPAILSRKAVIVVGLLTGGAFTGLAILAESDSAALAAISAALFFANAAGAAVWALAIVVAPPNATATVGAVQNFGGLVGGALAPIATGLMVQMTGSFVPALAATAAAALGGALVYLFGVRRPIAAPP